MKTKRTKWSDELIKEEIFKCKEILCIDRMPTSNELKSIGRVDLSSAICKTYNFSGWANRVGLQQYQTTTTRIGEKYENLIKGMLENRGYVVNNTTPKHIYDLLVNNCLKVDVKASKPGLNNGRRAHTFNLHNSLPNCDLYICLVIDEIDRIEKTLIIPSHKLSITSLKVYKESKYDEFIDKWEYVENYVKFFESVI
jgi:hypothetical protein